MEKLKIGIIGCGGIANAKHMPALAKVPQCEMVAFCDLVVERAEAAAKKFGISKSTVHKDLTLRLPRHNRVLYEKVRKILENNKAQRHIRGGLATQRKYRKEK